MLMDGIPYHVTKQWNAEYYCNCSKQRTEKVLISLGKKELAAIIEEGEDVELCCHLCDKKYLFTPNELKKLLLKGSEK